MKIPIQDSIDIVVNDFKFKAKTWGDSSNENRILAIHGWLDNANTFDKISPLLSEEYYIVAIDLAGHGLSDHRESNSDYYMWDYAIDILNCIDRLGWEKCTIIAHSMGTGIASIVAGAFPNRIEKLIFIDGIGPPFILEDNNELVANFKKAHLHLKMAKKTTLFGFSPKDTVTYKTKEEAINDRVKSKISPISYSASSNIINRGLKKITGGYRWSHDPKIVLNECYKMTENQALHFIRGIRCETLILLGKQGFFTGGLFNSRLENFNNVTVNWLEGNHYLHLEDESSIIPIVIHKFLQN